MLFNTLAYAQFFAVVFATSWLLVSRRWAPLLPWLGVALYAVRGPVSSLELALLALGFGVSAWVCRSAEAARGRAVAIACALAGVAFVLLVGRRTGFDAERLGMARWAAVALGLLGFALCVLVVRARKVRLLFILGASYVFYAHWDYRFLALIWGSSTVDWLLGNAIGRASSEVARKRWVAVTVALNLGVLGFFKYFDFGVDSARTALAALGFDVPELALRIALPVGISFFTFESMSYVIDVYRRSIEPHRSYLEYLTFVAFFPHLVAGPIVRPRDLLPQLAGQPRLTAEEGSEALWLIALGLFKKVAIGDYLALNLVDRVFDAPLSYSGLECYVAVLGYAIQIYCDFSGYTDIAIGSALLLGVRFPKNFDAPYKAHNIADFWRRWHISLSTWLRDYLYIPLGGNRRGRVRTYLNLIATMLLGGLWHGASWTFVVWGGLHGAALALTRLFHDLTGRSERAAAARGGGLSRLLGVLLTFHFVCAAWVFFRAPTFGKAALVFERISSFGLHHPNLDVRIVAVLGLGLAAHFLPERWYDELRLRFVRLPAAAQGVALACAAVAIRQMASAEAVPFVYFQF